MEGQTKLSHWAGYLENRYPELSFSPYPGFVLVWKELRLPGDQNVGLDFLPDFYLVLKKSEREKEEMFGIDLITFHGKILDHSVLSDDGDEETILDSVANKFRELRMCTGLEFSSQFHHNGEEFLVEHFNDNLVVRSQTCTYSVAECGNEKNLVCRNCEKMAAASKTTEIKPEPQEDDEWDEWLPEEDLKYETDSDEEEMATKSADEDFSDYNEEKPLKVQTYHKGVKRGRPKCSKVTKAKNKVVFSDKEKKRFKEEVKETFVDLKNENSSDEEMSTDPGLRDYIVEEDEGQTHTKQKKRGRPKRSKEETNAVLSPKRNKPFKGKCKICLYTFKNEFNFKDDQEKHEKFFDMNGSVACPQCSKTVAKIELTSHFQEEHSNNSCTPEAKNLTCCCECLEIMPNIKDALRQHIKTKHYRPVCDTCGKRYSSPLKLQMHIRSFHMDNKDVLCDNCGKAFGHPQSLKSHKLQVCNKTDDWPCSLCGKDFMTKAKLRRHLAVHSKCLPYKCKYCAYKTYKTNNIVPVHMKKQHGKSGSVKDIETLEDELDRMKTFVNLHMDGLEIVQKKKEFVQKQKQEHQIKKSNKQKQSLKCPLCKKVYASEDSIQLHFYIHSTLRPFKCKHCDFKSYTSTLVSRHHYKKVHGRGLPGRLEDVQVDLEELANMKAYATEQHTLVERMNKK